jgi:gliding-associated putative ABC transporter substrate-binding component GldG
MVMAANKSKALKQLGIVFLAIIVINLISNFFFKRFDLTQDKRYTLSETTLNIIKDVESPLYIEVYLEGNFPPEFKRLQNETKQLLEEFTAYNSNIIFNFKNPIEKEETRVEKMKEFYAKGMQPLSITVEDKGKQSQEVVFPWAQATYGDKFTKIALLKNLMGASTEQKVISSVQHLEFGFAEAINKISKEKQKKIAVIKGNGELQDRYLADFLKTARESYYIAPFTLDSVTKKPTQTLEVLKKYDLAVIAKPTEAFTEEEKQVLDQFIMNGGKTLWLVDVVSADMDSLTNSQSGTILAVQRELNLTDMLFKYGIRINPLLVKDEYGTPITLFTGREGSETQKQQHNWRFAPFAYPTSTHPIVKNMEGIKFEFASPIEILKNDIKKTVLLSSSEYSKTIGTPSPISLDMVTEETTPEEYEGKGLLPVAVLMEGKFKSAYQNRVLPFKDNSFQATGKENKMIVISDGDVIKNKLNTDGEPYELGFDNRVGALYGNKEFLMNCVNYLLDDNGLINIRSKDVDLPLLNKEEVYKNYTMAQMVTVGLPIVILAIFGFLFTFLRKRKYSR